MKWSSKKKLFNHCICHVQAYRRAGGCMVPKHHGFIHLTRSILFSGNPRFSATYEDESENGVIAAICKKVHRSTMIKSLFEHLEVLEVLEFLGAPALHA